MPKVWIPAHVRATTDLSEFYEKYPHEMSRYELKELEKTLMMSEEDAARESERLAQQVLDEHGQDLGPEEAYKLSDEYKGLQEEVRRLQPMRIGVFKRYWARFKYNSSKREELMEMFDAADQQAGFYYGEGFKSWRDEIEGVHEFLAEIRTKEREAEAKTQVKGNTIIRTIKGEFQDRDTQEIEYSSATFNPFSAENRKVQER